MLDKVAATGLGRALTGLGRAVRIAPDGLGTAGRTPPIVEKPHLVGEGLGGGGGPGGGLEKSGRLLCNRRGSRVGHEVFIGFGIFGCMANIDMGGGLPAI